MIYKTSGVDGAAAWGDNLYALQWSWPNEELAVTTNDLTVAGYRVRAWMNGATILGTYGWYAITAPTGSGSLTFDFKKGTATAVGTSIYTTAANPTIALTSHVGNDAVCDATTVATDDVLRGFVDAIGGTIPGGGVTCTVLFKMPVPS